MDVTPLVKSGTQVIQGYKNGGFTVSGTRYEGAVIVTPGDTQGWEFNGSVSELKINDFQSLTGQSSDIDVVLLGCGPQIAFLNTDLKKSLTDQGLPVDVMDTGAACRTYNVLVAEGRRVAAALLPT